LHCLEQFGFTIDISTRIVNGMWDIRYGRDVNPVAYLQQNGVTLEIFYQLYVGRADTHDMPDLAVRIGGHNGDISSPGKEDYLMVIDPKYGVTFTKRKLRKVAERYADAFSPCLALVHNYYPMSDVPGNIIIFSETAHFVNGLGRSWARRVSGMGK
jgi:hypothetical protein